MSTSSLKISFLSCIATLMGQLTFAQVNGGEHQKLFDLYVMSDYEKCLMKAEKIADDDDHRRESEPYLYMSMCLLKIAEDPELNELEAYKNAKKDAIKYGSKFKKKDDKLADKGGYPLFEDNIDYLLELKQVGIEEAKSYLAMDNFRKAVYYYKYTLYIDESDNAVRLIKGTCDLLSRNTKVGMEEVQLALEGFREIASKGAYEKNRYTEMAFEDGFLYYANYLIEKNNIAEAQEVMELARTLDPDNAKFTRKLKEITG